MQKPNNYAETSAGGNFPKIDLGGHKMIVKQISEKKTASGKDMLVVLVDTDTTDKQPHFFMDMFNNDHRQDKKYPNQATEYIVTTDNEGNCSCKLKGFCEALEQSNAGFSCWNKDDTFNFAGCKGKKIGAVFGEELDYYNGEEKKKRVIRWFCDVNKALDAEIPEISQSQAYKEYKNSPASALPDANASVQDFMNLPDIDDTELPFN